MDTKEYTLKVGAEGASRLELLNQTYGPSSRAFLLRSGLGVGQRVLELGCGTGTMTCWMASVVGEGGEVVGVDSNAEQLEIAKARAAQQGLFNVTFIQADARNTMLPTRFDLVYFRFLLMHLPAPGPALVLSHARDLLVSGGRLACEEITVDTSFCDPPCAAQQQLTHIATTMAATKGHDFGIARQIESLVQAAGFCHIQASSHQPQFYEGPEKYLELLSFIEVLEHVLRAGIATEDALSALQKDLTRTIQDPSVLYALSKMLQVCAHT